MACACKDKAKKVESLVPKIHGEKIERKGIKYYCKMIINMLGKIIQRIIAAVFVIVLILPVTIIVMFRTIIFNKPLKVKVPKKLLKFIQRIDKNG